MKIKMIDLLVKIVNGKESIDVETKYYSDDWVKDDFLFNLYNEFKYKNNYEIIDFLNDYVEIIKESKKIEKIPLPSFDEFKRMSAEERYVITAKEYDLLDELIDEINKLKEK